jgi:hypothetical protein
MRRDGRRALRRLKRLGADAAGQMTLEWALVLVLVALPMYFVCAICLNLLVAHFQMITFLETLPFP